MTLEGRLGLTNQIAKAGEPIRILSGRGLDVLPLELKQLFLGFQVLGIDIQGALPAVGTFGIACYVIGVPQPF
jgi:hypothetical protein